MHLKRIVVVGTGLAGLRATEALRREGYQGALYLIGDEKDLPYDRPPLSKQVLTGAMAPEKATFRSRDHFDELGVELRLGQRATGLDLQRQVIRTDEEAIPYDGLIIATGASAQQLPAATGREGVHVVRTLDDAVALRNALTRRPRVVVVGAGFIGAEVASSARALGLDTTVVEARPTPLARAVGERMGRACARLHRDHGTRLICGARVSEVVGHRRVEGVRVTDGRLLPADVLVVGIGAAPDTDWLRGSGVPTGNGVLCDSTLNAGHPAVYAAGDVASWPNLLFGERMRCEQWTNAADQGVHVARNLLANRSHASSFTGANYFWSDQYGVRIQFVGTPHAEQVDIVDGNEDEARFVAYYRAQSRIVGALAVNSPRRFFEARRLVEQQIPWDQAVRAARTA
ncbi:NAD(P)/FAD-dependent oxidoreductase [Pseudonocardia nigra]|uniref:NAD(P)/FAD-dependent oxidoreductase n=1 Tax=Pseudonocardia nigra TaxID=1921578 RepID=UPI001C60013F|nr:FAD-dependent oxidoreductase [Pseudonocardia nigra]